MKLIVYSSLVLAPSIIWAQGTLADYQRGEGLRGRSQGLVVNLPSAPPWIGGAEHFWYSKTVKGGTEFILVNADSGTKKPAFDHQRLAVAISSVTGHIYSALTLPFAPAMGGRGGGGRGGGGSAMTAPLTFTSGESAIEFGTDGSIYKCSLADYTCAKAGAIPQDVGGGRGARGGLPGDQSLLDGDGDSPADPEMDGGDPVDGLEYESPSPQQDGAGPARGAQSSG